MHLVAEDTAEALANCNEARKELVAYTQVEVPAVNAWSTLKIFLVYHMRPAFALFPCCTACLSPFHAELTRLGGPERISVLVTFARFDGDSNGEVDGQELVEYQRLGEALVASTSNQCSTLGVVAALLMTATHMTTVGRPIPLASSEAFTKAHGEDAAEAMLWVAYALNATTEMMAAVVLVVTIYTRLLLANILPSLGPKLAFLARSNVNGDIVLGCTYMIVFLLSSISAASLISSSSAGYYGCGIPMATLLVLIRVTTPHYFQGILRVHLDACRLLGHNQKDDIEAATSETAQFEPPGSEATAVAPDELVNLEGMH